MADIDVEAEAMALPACVRAAAEAIEASSAFRLHYSPAQPLGRLHPAAVEFARLAFATIPLVPKEGLITMGEWAMTIHGHGIHDNGRDDDADAIMARFVEELRKSQEVKSAVFTVGAAREIGVPAATR